MPETKTKPVIDMLNVEETLSAVAENNKKSLNMTMDFTRNSLEAMYKMGQNVQKEQVRFADAVIGQFTAFQKNYVESLQTLTEETMKYSDKVMKDNQSIVESAVDNMAKATTKR